MPNCAKLHKRIPRWGWLKPNWNPGFQMFPTCPARMMRMPWKRMNEDGQSMSIQCQSFSFHPTLREATRAKEGQKLLLLSNSSHKQCLICIVLLRTVQLCKWGCPFFFSGETAGGCRRQLKNTAVAVLIFLMDDYGWPSILKADWSPLRYSLHATFLEARPSPWRKIACLTHRMSPLENISTSCSTPCG